MAASIKSVHIENFRSIQSIDVNFSQLSVLVGRNDCGKSNILRALNLFFNGQTNPGIGFNFSEDYNFFAPSRNRKAKEILVRVEIALPETYQSTNGQVILWAKRWRADGLWGGEEDYIGQRILLDEHGIEYRENVEIPRKSNVHSLLRKIAFEYVPAIKDPIYFDKLRGRIYGVISEVATRTFRASSAEFEQSIGNHLNELTLTIADSLGLDTRLALPRDLSHIFERLDFLSGEKSVSLDNRGDGIKARHIPLILRFMAEKKAALQQRGAPPISNIWAYEEPENNLELASAVQLADELLQLANNRTAQVLLTTHSPAFYDLGQREEQVVLNYVQRSSDEDGTRIKSETDGLDESLGTLAMLAPRISVMVDEIRKQEAANAEAVRLAQEACPRIFVEGESDQIILERALALFFPGAVGRVRFETKRDGGGHHYVIDMLNGWRAQHKHHPAQPKAVGIVDEDATQGRDAFNRQQDNVKSAKCYVYPKLPAIRAARAAGFTIYASLETLYPKAIWDHEDQRGRLDERTLVKVCPAELMESIMRNQTTLDAHLHPDWAYLVQKDFKSERKIPTARRLAGQADGACRETLAAFEGVLREPLQFLGVL